MRALDVCFGWCLALVAVNAIEGRYGVALFCSLLAIVQLFLGAFLRGRKAD